MRGRQAVIGVIAITALVVLAGCTSDDLQDTGTNTDGTRCASISDAHCVDDETCDTGGEVDASCGGGGAQVCCKDDYGGCESKYALGVSCPDDTSSSDSDGDGVPDSEDNCPDTWGDSATGCNDNSGF